MTKRRVQSSVIGSIFVSHASEDKSLVRPIVTTLERFFAGQVAVKASTVPGTIPAGADWFDWINENVGQADVMMFLLTPRSVTRPWVWFELGVGANRHRDGQVTLLPLCCCIRTVSLPAPFSAMEAVDLTDNEHILRLLEQLAGSFGLGLPDGNTVRSISTAVRRYCKTIDNSPTVDPRTHIEIADVYQALRRLAEGHLVEPAAVDVLLACDLIRPGVETEDLRRHLLQISAAPKGRNVKKKGP